MFGLGEDENEEVQELVGQGYGGHSMVAPLRRVIMQAPVPPAEGGDGVRFGYPRPIDHELAAAEHAAFRTTLEANGIEVLLQPSNDLGLLDAIFVFDDSLITDEGAILARPGKEVRQAEIPLTAAYLEELGVPILGGIEEPGTVEIGDLMWINQYTIAVGHGYRTNQAGIEQLRIHLQTRKVDVIPVPLPHWHGPDECLHLLSLISPVAERTAVVHLKLLPVPFVEFLTTLEWTLIPIPEEEFPTQATNILALAPGKLLMLRDNVQTIKILQDAGFEVLTYAGDEISHNRAGGPTCLTRPLLRV